jgi:hypothetical protein
MITLILIISIVSLCAQLVSVWQRAQVLKYHKRNGNGACAYTYENGRESSDG